VTQLRSQDIFLAFTDLNSYAFNIDARSFKGFFVSKEVKRKPDITISKIVFSYRV